MESCNLCGIIAILSKVQEGFQVSVQIREALKRLEYRGYDSVGIATIDSENKRFQIKKDKGKIDEVHARLNLDTLPGRVGIGHTRWATHGKPSKVNSHPHLDGSGKISVIHNGIIENFISLRNQLIKLGHEFKSECDTEIIPHLIEEELKKGINYEEAVHGALTQLQGSYAIAVLNIDEPEKIIVARKESPLIIGLGENALYAASDIPAFLPMTNKVKFLLDEEMAILTLNSVQIRSIRDFNTIIERETTEIQWTTEMAKKGGMSHFMLKEIHEQPNALRNTLRMDPVIVEKFAKYLKDAPTIYFTAAGTSFHATMAGQFLLARIAKTISFPFISSEFKDRIGETIGPGSVVIAITQSGETADTLNAVVHAKSQGAKILAITNVLGSSITRHAEAVLYTQAGPEIGVAATKTFIVQIATLSMLALTLAEMKNSLPPAKIKELRSNLDLVPDFVEKIIKLEEDNIKIAADQYAQKEDFFYLGRGLNFATAAEGALKLKEISYNHAEAYPAGESKHGPIALIESGFPVVFVAPPDETQDRIISNVMEMKAREALILAVCEENDHEIIKLSDVVFRIPSGCNSLFSPMTYVVPLQLFSYYSAIRRGYNPDQPRNLAKVVTVL
ncbi:MAG: glutamine--fructose-6-phosphate transaminase (isomerizing) [Candidatus Helarchaeota archaeon]